MLKVQSFGFMVEQNSSSMNFQHGATYLSPSLSKAVRYAINNRFGSELLTYSLDFLEELIRRKGVVSLEKLYQNFSHIFELIDIPCAPILISARHIPPTNLLNEHGGNASENIRNMLNILKNNNDIADILLQQTNFRLRQAVPLTELTFWLINARSRNKSQPDYSLHLLSTPGASNNDAQHQP